MAGCFGIEVGVFPFYVVEQYTMLMGSLPLLCPGTFPYLDNQHTAKSEKFHCSNKTINADGNNNCNHNDDQKPTLVTQAFDKTASNVPNEPPQSKLGILVGLNNPDNLLLWVRLPLPLAPARYAAVSTI